MTTTEIKLHVEQRSEGDYVYADDHRICYPLAPVDAAELVRRWNAFPALVAACEKMIAAVKDMHGRGGIVAIVPGMHLFEPFEAARAALAAAEVQS